MSTHLPFPWTIRRTLWGATVGCVCLSAALVATWPLALNASKAIPLGTEHEATVPLFNLWSLWWTADRAAHGFAHYWDAPFFYPNKGVFTYSEPQPLTGLLVAPLWGLGTPPPLIYNLAVLALLTLNGVFAYRLARALDVPPLFGLLSGLLTVTLPFVSNVHGVLPIIAVFGMPWTLEGLVRFGRDGTTRSAIWAASGFIATYLTCQQYALLFAPFAAMAGLVAVAQRRFQAAAVVRLLLVSLAMGVVLLMVAFPALRVHAKLGFRRPERVVQALSARPVDFLTRPTTALFGVPPLDPRDTAGLFPGAILSALAIAGAMTGVRERAWRRWAAYLVGSAVIAGLLAMGLNLSLAGWRPFATLRVLVPGMERVRSPFRFAMITQLFLPILAAIALTHVRRVLANNVGGALVILVGVAAAAENLSVPVPLTPVPRNARASWTAWLAAQPDRTVVAHVPFPAGLHVSDYEIEAWRLFAQIDHRKPIVNGYSGYFPQARGPDGVVIPTYTQFQLAMATWFPDRRLLCGLDKRLGVNTLIVGQDWLAGHKSQMDAHADFLRPVYADEKVRIYSLSAPEGKCRPGTW